jgi:hypothetical protein
VGLESKVPACPVTAGGTWPKVGSPEWCACLDELVKWVSSFGDETYNWLFPQPGEGDDTGFWGSVLTAIIPGAALVKGLQKLAKALSDKLSDKVRVIFGKITDQLSHGSVCNPRAVLGVELLRALLGALRNLRVGTDALVWATIDLNYGISVLDRILHYVGNFVCPVEIPSWGEVAGCYLANSAPEGILRCWAALGGHDWDVNKPVLDSLRRRPQQIESYVLRNRELISQPQLDGALRQIGFTNPLERDLVGQLRFEVPGSSDLVRFAVRHVFEPDLIQQLGYASEQQGILDAFHNTAGINYPIFSGPLKSVITKIEADQGLAPGTFLQRYTAAGLKEPTWASAYWWSHWVLPSPGMGYSMLQRLRPTGGPNNGPRDESGIVFDAKSLALLLRANDYPPFWRDKLAAISYRVPSMRFLRTQLQYHSIDEREAGEQLQDMGYRPRIAKQMAAGLAAQLQEQENEKLLKLILKQVEEGWEIGIVDDADFVQILADAGVNIAETQTRINAASAKRNVDLAKKLVDDLHKAYLRGAFDWSQTAKFLDQVGITPRRQIEYHRFWDAERQASPRELTAQQLINFAVDGLTDLPSVAKTLRNLNYSDSAISILLGDIRMRLAAKVSRDAEKLHAEALKGERALQQQVRQLAAAQRATMAALSRHGSPAKLKTWYCNGDISGPDVTARLTALGWPQADIDRLLGECDAKRTAAGLAPYAEEAPGAEA